MRIYNVLFVIAVGFGGSIQAMEPEDFHNRRFQVLALTPQEFHQMRQAQRDCCVMASNAVWCIAIAGSCASIVCCSDSIVAPLVSTAAIIVSAEVLRRANNR